MVPEQGDLFAGGDGGGANDDDVDANVVPNNEGNARVSDPLEAHILGDDDVLLVTGYAGLPEVVRVIAQRKGREAGHLRIVFGSEPYPAAGKYDYVSNKSPFVEMRDYWLARGISVVLACDVLDAIQVLKRELVDVRIGGSTSKRQHAKLYIGQRAAMCGSSNLTGPGLRRQHEANTLHDKGSAHYRELRKLGEKFWVAARPFKDELIRLLGQLLQAVTWQEALARACAETLGESAHDDAGLTELALWPHQRSGIRQAMYLLETMGAVLVADATGSGKTRQGLGLMYEVAQQRRRTGTEPTSDDWLLAPNQVLQTWEDGLNKLPMRGARAAGHGSLSSQANKNPSLVRNLRRTELVVVDEAHRFYNSKSQRTRAVTQIASAQRVLLTATPINRGSRDLVSLIRLLGPDQFEQSTLELVESFTRKGSLVDEQDFNQIRGELSKFTMRRTRRDLVTEIERAPREYVDGSGIRVRYPEHRPLTYEVNATSHEQGIATAIGKLAAQLRGLVFLGKSLIRPSSVKRRRILGPDYVAQRTRMAAGLARYMVRSRLRSSCLALLEHTRGTAAALEFFNLDDVRSSKKSHTKGVIHSLKRVHRPSLEKGQDRCEWLLTDEAFERAKDRELALYFEIAGLCEQLAANHDRERSKVDTLLKIVREHDRIVAFDDRLISLNLFANLCREQDSDLQICLATGAQSPRRLREIRKLLARESTAKGVIVLCSDVLSEGVNLQGASALIHLDMPTVVRIAEQRTGRIDRLDSPHGRIAVYWPNDVKEFRPLRSEQLIERNALVQRTFGANLMLPSDEHADHSADEFIEARAMINLVEEARELGESDALLGDAFDDVRNLAFGDGRLIPTHIYERLVGSSVRVTAAVSVVASRTRWALAVVQSPHRTAPRWLLIDLEAGTMETDLRRVIPALRERLLACEDVKLDRGAVSDLRLVAEKCDGAQLELLSRARRRALESAIECVRHWRKDPRALGGDGELTEVLGRVERLLTRREAGQPAVDLNELARRWQRYVVPFVEDVQAKKPKKIVRPSSEAVLAVVRAHPWDSASAKAFIEKVPQFPPASERIVSLIIAVKPDEG